MIIAIALPLNKYCKIFILGVLTVGSLLTFSKIGIFVVALVLLLGLLKFNPNKYLKLSLLIIVPIILLAVQYFNVQIPLLFDSSSWIDRNNLLLVAKDLFVGGHLFGVGNFIAAMSGSAPTTVGGFLLLQPVHNIFVLYLVENGILGLVFQAAIIVGLYIKQRGSIKINQLFESRIWFMASVALVLLGSFDHYLISLPQGQFLLMIYFVYSASLVLLKDSVPRVK
jgi:hypothetical protein